MDVAVILTYRCNSKCSMCHVWQNPSSPTDEVSLEVLAKIPSGIDYLNLTGGEPTLRTDLMEIVDLLYPKARTLEISSNGLYWPRLEPVIRKYPNVKIRFSLEGIGEVNNQIRGEVNGFEKKVEGIRRLKELGGTDLGFGVVIQDENVEHLEKLFELCEKNCIELATSTLHNGFQFHKSDNYPYDRPRVANAIKKLIVKQLRTRSVKSWFRAYLNLGLMAKILGRNRILPCTAATDFVFVDPWADVYACNVRHDLKLGNLSDQGWDSIMTGTRAAEIRSAVGACRQNCWMVGSAKTAMRWRRFPNLPRFGPLLWVLENKARLAVGLPVRYPASLDWSVSKASGPLRPSHLEAHVHRDLRSDGGHYSTLGPYDNH